LLNFEGPEDVVAKYYEAVKQDPIGSHVLLRTQR